MTKTASALFLFFAAASPAFAVEPEALAPSYLPVSRPAQEELTAGLREKVRTLGLNGLPGPEGGKVSKALLLLPNDRARAGVINFELEAGSRAGVYQCEALGRGITSTAPADGWQWGFIGGTKIFYAPEDVADGATVPGVYDLRNISPDRYELAFLGKPGTPEEDAGVPVVKAGGKKKKLFSAVWRNWYPAAGGIMPVDLVWAEDSQAGTQGEGVPFFERRPAPSGAASKARQAAQLAHNPKYYFGPHGRSGFAVHTDRWEDELKKADPRNAGRPELADFRWRDTNGCVKLRPGCLALLNKFIEEQSALGRRVQLEIKGTELLDEIPVSPPAVRGQ
jgi:hypothetical protein